MDHALFSAKRDSNSIGISKGYQAADAIHLRAFGEFARRLGVMNFRDPCASGGERRCAALNAGRPLPEPGRADR